MKASELRIGNWVSLGLSTNRDNWYQIEDDEMIELTSELTQGIYLSEEWLYRCGFLCFNFSRTQWIKGTSDTVMVLDFDKGSWFVSLFSDTEQHWVGDYVHQLQNLYFALTGTELEIK